MARDWQGGSEMIGGKPVRTHRVTCGACQATDALHGMDMGAAEAARQIPRKFERRGWHIAQRASYDRCPACVAGLAAERRNRRTKAMPGNIPAPKPEAAPPREPTPAEMRRVLDAIEQHYPTPGRGYAGAMRDEALAASLGVPRVWVTRVRVQFFGPESDVDLKRIEAEVAGIQTAHKALEDTVMAETDKIGRQLESVVQQLDGVRAQLRGAA